MEIDIATMVHCVPLFSQQHGSRRHAVHKHTNTQILIHAKSTFYFGWGYPFNHSSLTMPYSCDHVNSTHARKISPTFYPHWIAIHIILKCIHTCYYSIISSYLRETNNTIQYRSDTLSGTRWKQYYVVLYWRIDRTGGWSNAFSPF